MIVIALCSTVFLMAQDLKTKTIHLIPLTTFILSIVIRHHPKIFNVKLALLVSLFYVCLHAYERMQKKVYLGFGDVIVILMIALIFSDTLFYVTLSLSSMIALIVMTLTKTKVIAFIPSLLVSFWSVYVYEIFFT